jgi:hypothetical protein
MRPHVVILGAGASVAAFPQGDETGKMLPTMDNLVEVVGLRPILEDSGVDYHSQNFEKLYSQLHEREPNSPLLKTIENTIRDYFEELQLPEEPTLYDHLVLSLRPKDIVATFNWDPFLFDAWKRHRHAVPVPDIIHLHGNVRIAYCIEHKVQGENGMCCPHCEKKLTPSRLLYPVAKNYADDPLIDSEWKTIESYLRSAFTLTIFGYGAPETDKEAFELMTKAWKGKSQREIETIEIIDRKEKDALIERWEPFMPTFHCKHNKDFYESIITQLPRRCCEGLYVTTILGRFAESFPLPKEMKFKELMLWLEPLIEAEQSVDH